MYVTRRFLRSTIPSSGSSAGGADGARKSSSRERRGSHEQPSQPEEEESSASDMSSPRRRPVVRSKRSGSSHSESAHDEPATTKKASPRASRSAAQLTKPAEKSSKEDTKAVKDRKSSSTGAAAIEMKDAVNKAERVGLGMLVDARDTQERWCEAKIVDLNAKKREVFVHYVGWNARYDAWLSVKFLTAHGSHTGDSKKNASSWDGKTSLFTMENAVKKESSGHNAEPQKGVMSLKSPSSSIVKKKVAAKAEPEVRNASPVSSRKRRSRSDQSNHKEVDETKDSEHESDLTPSEKRPKRSAAARADSKISVKPELPVKAEPQDKQKQKKSKKASVKVHPVRVVVATTDEASERKSRRNRKENVDMEFDMDVRGGHESTSASEDEDAEPGAESASDDDSLTRLKKSKKKKLKKTSAANNKTKVSGSRRTTAATQVSTKVKEAEVEETKSDADTLPPVASPSQGKRHAKKAAASESPPTTTTAVSVKKQQQQSGKSAKAKGGNSHSKPAATQQPRPPIQMTNAPSSATRERLAAIFRLRVQQKQQLQQHLSSDSNGGMQSLQDEVRQAAAAGMNPLAITPTAAASASHGATYDEAAAAQEAYVHYHHAQQLQQYYYQQAMLASSMHMQDADEAALQGGIMDPRVIQARMDALELQRRIQQQQLHDYYQHVAITRERNMQTLASDQDFLLKSGHAWQQQTARIQEQHGSEDTEQALDAASGSSSKESETCPSSAEMNELEEKMQTANVSIVDSSDKAKTMEASASTTSTGSAQETPVSLEKQQQLGGSQSGKDTGPSVDNAAAGASTSNMNAASDEKKTSVATTSAKEEEDKGSVLYEFVL